MIIEIKSLALTNFKGIRNIAINFNLLTNIYGDNGTGKTTIADAINWLLFDKDSKDRKDFNIKTLDSTGNAIPMVDHEVSGVLAIDGVLVELRKVYVEKWTKRRGSETTEFTGHETTYFYNGVPCTQKEYKAKIDAICSESLFKLLTNPLYFPTMEWTKQRELIFKVAGSMSDSEIADSDKRFKELFASFSGKTLEEYKREITAKKSKAKEELEKIPSRIDEVKRSIPEEVGGLDKEKKELDNAIKALDEAILDTTKANKKANDEKLKIQNEIFELQSKQNEIVSKEKEKANQNLIASKSQQEELKRNITKLERDREDLIQEENRYDLRKKGILNYLDELRESFQKVKSEAFDETSIICPTCQREYDSSKQSEIKSKFNEDKSKRLTVINNQGVTSKQDLEKCEIKLQEISSKKNELTESISKTQELYDNIILPEVKTIVNSDIPEWVELEYKIQEKNKITFDTAETGELNKEKSQLQNKLSDIEGKLAVQKLIPERKSRLVELEERMRTLSQEIASYEKVEFIMKEFDKAKVEAIEGKINSMFEVVKFKLFETQINGAEIPTCQIQVDGVPFSDLNTAMRVYAGIDVIKVLSDFYKIHAPVVVDNRESISVIPNTKSQIINLEKVTGQKSLIIK